MEFFFLKINKVVINLIFIREGWVKFKNFIFDMVTKFHSWVVFYVIIKICTCWPYKWKDQHHWTTCISIKIGHFIKILLCYELIKHDIKDIDTTLHKIIVNCSDNFLTLLPQESEIFSKQVFHLLNDIYNICRNDILFFSLFLKVNRPCINNRLPSQMYRF